MRDAVEIYYGSVLKSSRDLRTNACQTSARPPTRVAALIDNVHDAVRGTYYGCGLVYPPVLSGARVLDLGCGTGQDCYVLSQLVGQNGFVVGVDMTQEQLDIARRHLDYHTERFGYDQPNVAFHKGYIEKLDDLGLAPVSFDIVVSNCVINLSVDKAAVLRQVNALLAAGGEMYFSDVYTDRRVPRALQNDPVLYGECLSGAMYWQDFHTLAGASGFRDPRLVEDNVVAITDPEIRAKIGHIGFHSATYRLFKLPELEPACEDYGQAVLYKGTIPDHETMFVLDKHHRIERGRVFPVCGNTWRMLHDTRFAPHFDFIGDWAEHYGTFDACGTASPFTSEVTAMPAAGGCC